MSRNRQLHLTDALASQQTRANVRSLVVPSNAATGWQPHVRSTEETDFGQSLFGDRGCPANFGQSQFRPIHFWIWCVSWPNGWGPTKIGPRRVGAQNFALFSVSRSHFRSFCVSLGVFSWLFGCVWKRRGRQMFTFGVLGLSCEARHTTKTTTKTNNNKQPQETTTSTTTQQHTKQTTTRNKTHTTHTQ